MLDQIAKAGYSYSYVPLTDLATDQKFFLVDAIKGDGPRIAAIKSTMNEAVQEFMRLLNMSPLPSTIVANTYFLLESNLKLSNQTFILEHDYGTSKWWSWKQLIMTTENSSSQNKV